MKTSTQSMVKIALAVALIALGAQIKIPSPIAGYFTLQLPMVLITAIVLGTRDGVKAICLYIIGGLIGIPWFASGGGIGYLVTPTFGFILSFVAASYIVSKGSALGCHKKTLISTIIAVLLVWIIGMVYYTTINVYYLGKTGSYISALLSILSIDLAFDLLLGYMSSLTGMRVKRALGV